MHLELLFAALVGSASLASGGAVLPQCSPAAPILWGLCPTDLPKDVQCAQYKVPIDYSKPNGEMTTLAAIRKKSESPKPKGSVFLNPGGPGTSGIQAVLSILPGSQPSKILAEYDLLGVDPRGVGQSTPIKCDPAIWNKRVPTLVDNEAQFDAMVQHWKEAGESCRRLTGPLLDFMDTKNVARDFEQLRQAFGESKFNFIGLSYGSQIGYTYAEMFPSNVDRMALDGIVDHTKPRVYAVEAEANTLETTLHRFIDWCGNNKTCALHNNTDIAGLIKRLAAKAEVSPIPAPKCEQSGDLPCQSNVNREDFLAGIQGGLILKTGIPPYQPGWSELAEYLLAASKGDASGLSAHYYVGETDTTGDFASLAVGCQDWEHAKGFADLHAIEDMTKVFAPLTLGITQSLSYVTRCVAWSTSLKNPQQPIRQSIADTPEILLVNSFWDPAASVQWAVSIREQIPNSSLIFRHGSGHTSYGLNGDTSKAMNAFLLTGNIPADGTTFES